MRRVGSHLTTFTAAMMICCVALGINAFTASSSSSSFFVSECKRHACCHQRHNHFTYPKLIWMSSSSSSSNNESPPTILVNQEAFIRAIDVLMTDMGNEIISTEPTKPMYAIGKLVAQLPVELASGIRFADCETLTLISQLKESVVEVTGMQSLDTIVAIRVVGDDDGSGAYYRYEKSTNGASIADTAQAYSDAIKYAMQNNIKGIELEVNRLVPLIPSTE
jgi:hypothetical protein